MQIVHTKRVCKDFEINNLGEYYDLYVQSNRLLPADDLKTFGICALKYKSSTLIFLHQKMLDEILHTIL